MKIGYGATCVVLAVSCVLLTVAGCSKKSVQASSGSKSSEAAKRAAAAKSAGIDSGSYTDQSVGSGKPFEPDYSTPDYGADAPSLSLSDGDMGSGGLDMAGNEGRTGAPTAEPGSGRGMGEMSTADSTGTSGSEEYGSARSGPLSGLDSLEPGAAPSEERLGSGTLLAKVQPGEIAQRQAEELRREQMETAEAGLMDVFFDFDSWRINEHGRQALSGDAEWIRENPGILVKVEGHCDERGTSAYNLVLGEKRAKAVRNYLVELGVPANHLLVVSYGKERPFCYERSEPCFQQNRRGHLVVKPR